MARSASSPPPARPTPHPAARVLVVDDDPKILQHCQELLEGRGYVVTSCAKATEVLGLMKQKTFDAALLDIRMPGLEGTELLPLIKKYHPELPVIFVSAYCNDADAAYYRSLGAADIIAKPFSHEVLADTVARAVKRETRIPLTLTSLSLAEGRDHLYRKLMVAALQQAQWNQVQAAKLLGISRYSLIRWMKRLGITGT